MRDEAFSIGIFVSSISVGDEIKKIAEAQKDILQISYKGLEDAITTGKKMEKEGVEVVISRRGTAHLLRENLHVPVLSFPQSSLSVLASIKEAASRLEENPHQKRKVFMPNFRNEISGLEIVEELLDIEFTQGIYVDSASLRQIINRAAQDGFRAVVGGASTMRFAMEYGLNFAELITSKEDVIETIENAKSAARSSREEKATTQRYQSIMDAASDGILSVDSTGKLTTINQKARHIFKAENRNILGASIAELIPNVALARVFQKKTPIQDKVEKIGNELFIFNYLPLRMNDSIIGAVSSLKEVAQVMRVENKVRRTLTKGFVAQYVLNDLIYQSPSMGEVVNKSNEFAKTDSTILIMGETGTGKEVIAQSIHNLSRRMKRPFVSVHCGALPEQLLESELFGYEEGAFTGSKKGGKPGLFEMAHQGTIFLDEIDSTSQSVQLRLLRVLQEKEVMRIGADRKIPIDVRVIAAAGKNLWTAVQESEFRKDLFFRLNVLRITIPPLREREEDIRQLLHHFIDYYANKHDIRPIALPETYMQQLSNYSWPGNVRQIKHFAEQLILNSSFRSSTDILESLFDDLCQIVDENRTHSTKGRVQQVDTSLRLSNPQVDAETIRKALTEAKFSKTKAAELLGISRTTLWRKLKQLEI